MIVNSKLFSFHGTNDRVNTIKLWITCWVWVTKLCAVKEVFVMIIIAKMDSNGLMMIIMSSLPFIGTSNVVLSKFFFVFMITNILVFFSTSKTLLVTYVRLIYVWMENNVKRLEFYWKKDVCQLISICPWNFEFVVSIKERKKDQTHTHSLSSITLSVFDYQIWYI